jgi:8-oxo-dGTP pyrophosphatase MutT (NUDIX family)
VLLRPSRRPDDGWGVRGGAIDIAESLAGVAVRKAREEIGADVEYVRPMDAVAILPYVLAMRVGCEALYFVPSYSRGRVVCSLVSDGSLAG